jgi:HK97 family phage prohead protease
MLDRRAKAELLKGRECRRSRVAPLELRDDGGTLTLAGYASVTEKPYDMGWYTETIGQGAFTKTLSETPDVQLLINHEGLPLARSTTGSLRLSEDEKGLHVEADLDPDDPDVARLAPKMARGDVDEMSFAFRAVRQEWDEDYTERRLNEVSIDRGDVSVVSYGANPATSVSFRAYADSLLELRAGKQLSSSTMATLQEVLDLVSGADDNVDDAQVILSELMGVPNPDDPEPDAEPGADQQNSQSLDWLRARATIARHRAVA